MIEQRVSVILRCRNEERYIGHCLQSLDDFLYEPEIILLNNNSTDNSIRVVNTFDWMDIKKIQIDNDNYTPGRSLNIGVEEASNPIILILSAHCELVEFDIDNVINAFDYKKTINNKVACIWGKQIPVWDGKRVTPRYIWSNFKDKDAWNYFCEAENRYFLHNAFAIYKRNYLEEFPFDERLSGKEDRYWANDRIENGDGIYYDSKLVCKHHYTDGGATWKGVG